MLVELRIRQLAILESVVVALRPGFNVLSGETGAGKSIIVGALGLLLGERASADLVRPGAERASVEGVFDASARPEILRTLDARGIEVEDGLVVLRREIAVGGRTRAWVNGTSVTSGALAEVGRALVNMHGQHESQSLLQGDVQQALLDAFGGAEALVAGVRAAHEALADVRARIADLGARRDAAMQRADYLRHVVQEIDQARLVAGEDAALDDEIRRLANVEALRAHAAQVREALDGEGDGAALRAIAAAQRALASAARLDPTLARFEELLDAAAVQLDDVVREVTDYEEALEVDPSRLAQAEQRRDLVLRLVRKHGGSVGAALEVQRAARAELDLIDTATLDLPALTQREGALHEALLAQARELTAARVRAARELAREVGAIFPALGLADGRLEVALLPRDGVGRAGAEDVEYRVSLNPGHDPRALARVASGGELARVMLALKTILARLDGVPTLVFDEVDAGIGGKVGLAVGDTMRQVAAHHQVFAITHLHQLAARAHHHIVVAKDARGGVTTADLRVVDGEARVVEVARMLGGDPESPTSLAHARELLESAQRPVEAPSPPGRRRGAPAPRR